MNEKANMCVRKNEFVYSRLLWVCMKIEFRRLIIAECYASLNNNKGNARYVFLEILCNSLNLCNPERTSDLQG